MMSERFNVAGALLVKIFGKPHYEADVFRERTGRVQRYRRHYGHVRPDFLHRPHTHGLAWLRPWFTASVVSWSSTRSCRWARWWR